MNPALLKLLRLQARAVVRRMFRGARTKRGAVFLIISCIIFVMQNPRILESQRINT